MTTSTPASTTAATSTKKSSTPRAATASTSSTLSNPEEAAELANCARAIATCDTCGEEWFRGPCDYPRLTLGQPGAEVCFHEQAPSRYWKHVRNSERHQAIVIANWNNTRQILERLPAALAEAKAYKKLMDNPLLQPLRKLFR